MMTRTNVIDNKDLKNKAKDYASNIFYQDIIKTMVSALEMLLLVKRHLYDENVINKYNKIINSNSVT
jgi:hypothetical protein